ncbi:hypothetical protein [Streptomyces sp. 6N223]|uniref:hypothetical protein n=1 Tax=Streptomyces sp. 6N223 TaxID=3457412 RepID=UPI003FD2A1CE
MTITDELRKNLTNTTPLYVAAGTADLALQKLRELPATVERLRTEAPERLPKLREQAQTLALQSVGVALEYAVKARETYDELAQRGKTVVETRLGEGGTEAATETRVTVEREDVPVTEPVTEPVAEPEVEDKAEPEPKAKAAPRARKTTARRKPAPKPDAKDA